MSTTDIEVPRIEQAASLIDPVFRNGPPYVDHELYATIGRHVLVRAETATPVRSFKGRGADFLARTLEPGRTVVRIRRRLRSGSGVRRSTPAVVAPAPT